MRILLGVTGSVAAVRTPELAAGLVRRGADLKVVVTGAALAFFDPNALPQADPASLLEPGRGHTAALRVRDQSLLYTDADEWPSGRRYQLGEPVLHIELRRWAEVLLIAPLDANTLGKLAFGLNDNLLTCVYRAWEPDRPILLAPAMNTRMWEHPATSRHLRQLCEDHGGVPGPRCTSMEACTAINATCPYLRVIPPQSKRLACGDVGPGGMAELVELVRAAFGE